MFKGLFLALSSSATALSLILTITARTNLLRENVITGATVGTNTIASYSLIALFISFLTMLLAIVLIKK